MSIKLMKLLVPLLATALLVGCAPLHHRHDDSQAQADATTAALGCKKGGVLFDTDGKPKPVKADCGAPAKSCSSANPSKLCNSALSDPNNADLEIGAPVTVLTVKRKDKKPVDSEGTEPSTLCCVWGYVRTTTGTYPYCVVKPLSSGSCP